MTGYELVEFVQLHELENFDIKFVLYKPEVGGFNRSVYSPEIDSIDIGWSDEVICINFTEKDELE